MQYHLAVCDIIRYVLPNKLFLNRYSVQVVCVGKGKSLQRVYRLARKKKMSAWMQIAY
jgi:hypothetical protein